MKRKISILISCLLGFNLLSLKLEANSERKDSIPMRVDRLQSTLTSLDQDGSTKQMEQTKSKEKLLLSWSDWRDWRDWPNY